MSTQIRSSSQLKNRMIAQAATRGNCLVLAQKDGKEDDDVDDDAVEPF